MSDGNSPTVTPRASRKALLLALLIGLAAGVLTAVVMLAVPGSPDGPRVESSGKALIGGPFSLLDATGKRVTEKEFAGRPMLVYFGFTNCPDVCPAGLQVIAAALDRLGPDTAGKVAPLFITVDPERDTPEVLGQYVKSFHPNIIALSGTVDDILGVTKVYRVYVKKVPDEADPTQYSVDHSSFMYLMDGNGGFVRHFPHSVDAAVLADELSKAVAAEAKTPAT